MRMDREADALLAVAIVVGVILWAAVCFAGTIPDTGQTPGPRLADDPDQLTWTTSQHIWWMVHELWDVLIPALVGVIVGGGLWHKRKQAAHG